MPTPPALDLDFRVRAGRDVAQGQRFDEVLRPRAIRQVFTSGRFSSHAAAMADVSDRDIMATALLVIKEHGQMAVFYAAGRADELLEQGVHNGAVTWRLILGEIKRLQAMKPEGGVN